MITRKSAHSRRTFLRHSSALAAAGMVSFWPRLGQSAGFPERPIQGLYPDPGAARTETSAASPVCGKPT